MTPGLTPPSTPTHPSETPWQQLTLFLLTLGVLVLIGLILHPFFAAIIGAIVLAVITQHPYNWLAKKIPHASTCAAVGLLIVILIVIVPGVFLAQDLIEQAAGAIHTLRSPTTQDTILNFLDAHPTFATRIEPFTDSINLHNSVRTATLWIGHRLGHILQSSVRIITQIVVMLFILFFLFRDRALALRSLRSLIPLRPLETSNLLTRLNDTILATALGRLTIAAIQGTLAGLAYWLLGVPGVFLWAIMTAILAMIPAFGALLVWVPIAGYLVLNGHWGKAIILAVWGGLIVSTIDNFLYPILIGPRLHSHTAIILISILGGIALFGITGIVLGPVCFTIAATLLDIWRARTTPLSDPTPSLRST